MGHIAHYNHVAPCAYNQPQTTQTQLPTRPDPAPSVRLGPQPVGGPVTDQDDGGTAARLTSLEEQMDRLEALLGDLARRLPAAQSGSQEIRVA